MHVKGRNNLEKNTETYRSDRQLNRQTEKSGKKLSIQQLKSELQRNVCIYIYTVILVHEVSETNRVKRGQTTEIGGKIKLQG